MSRILIGDDDRELCALLAEYLRREGLQVEVVHDGDAVLTQLRDPALRPDLLILDVMLPGRSGLDTLSGLNSARTIIFPSHAYRANCWRVCARSCVATLWRASAYSRQAFYGYCRASDARMPASKSSI
jgi:response regulator of citrate/malate metabolism